MPIWSRPIKYASFFAVVQGEGEHSLQIVEELRAFFLIQREDHFAVGTGLELVAIAILRAQRLVVVDLAVNGQRMGFFRRCTAAGPRR